MTAGMAIYDTIRYVKSDIVTVCAGQVGGIAALLLAAGTKGKRYALPSAEVVFCPIIPGKVGEEVDIAIQAPEILSIRQKITEIMAQHMGQTV